ncbi:MAG: RNA 2',3'-cyclic phosphodiesterase [Actinobacteria bacterium]|nr:RNA 2',3'-cyclic phosphodiesterase [Actinomycetota bacterium]
MESDERLRLFLALRLPDDAVAVLAEWQARELDGAGRIVPPEHLHVTLAFLGSRPAAELRAIAGALRDAAAAARPFELSPERYRETRSAGMLVLIDESGEAGRLAMRLHRRLEELGVYRRESRPWLPHVTVVRYRERPRRHPPLPALGSVAPSDAAAFLSRLHPSGARYTVLESFGLDSFPLKQ